MALEWPQGFPKVRCQALLRLRKGSDRSKYPILGCGYADRQVPGTLQTENGNALGMALPGIDIGPFCVII